MSVDLVMAGPQTQFICANNSTVTLFNVRPGEEYPYMCRSEDGVVRDYNGEGKCEDEQWNSRRRITIEGEG